MAAAAGEPIPGVLCKLYYDADGTIASPTWVEVTKAAGVQIPTEWTESEVMERTPRVVTTLLCHQRVSITVKMVRRPGNTVFDAFMTAARTGSEIGIAAMSGTITDTGEYGWQFEAVVQAANDDQEHTSNEVTFTLKPSADFTTTPAFVLTS